MKFHPIQCLTASSLTAITLLLHALPAHAIGPLADVQIIDRDSGETLAIHRHQGESWVAGRPGARYAVSVRNATGERVMTVVSVDGVNVVSGETAAWDQTGYVLSPWQRYDITGWRKTDAEVAAFHFTALPNAYATRTGRPEHVGVIGVAVFREKPPVAMIFPYQMPYGSRGEAGVGSPSAAPAGAAAESAPADAATQRKAPAAGATRLGTGHGEREDDRVNHTTFERRSHQPDDIIRIRYDSRENLITMGVIGSPPVPPQPNPFPAPTDPHRPRYVPDPS